MYSMIESLEARRLLSASPFGKMIVIAQPLEGEVAGEPLVNSRTALTDSGLTLALLDGNNFTAFNAPKMIVRWGDGSAPLKSPTTLVSDIHVVANLPDSSTHAYRQPGVYQLNVTFKYQNHTVATLSEPVHVGQNSPLGSTIIKPSRSTFTASLGSFEAIQTVAAGSAQIDWGDGKTSSATLSNNADDQPAHVTGSHSYTHPGKYRIAVTGTFAPSAPPGEFAAAFVSFQKMFSTIIVRSSHGV